MAWQYVADCENSKEKHSIRPFFSCGAHLFPFFMCVTIASTLVACLAMYYRFDRQAIEICKKSYQPDDACQHSKMWIVPTVSYTGQSDPEWLIFGSGLSVGAIFYALSVYYSHRRAWAAALYKNVAVGKAGKLLTDPRVFCVPCCCCTSKEDPEGDEKNQFLRVCFCSTSARPSLRLMLKVSETCGYISAFFLFFVGWARMTWSYEVHNVTALGFFAPGIIYMPVYTLAQHQIKKKCPAKFFHVWRYIFKVTVCACLIVIGLTYVFVYLDLQLTCGSDWATSNFRRIGFSVGEYLAVGFIGLFLLSHVDDIRCEKWYLQSQKGLEFQTETEQGSDPIRIVTNADYQSSFPEPTDDPITVAPSSSF